MTNSEPRLIDILRKNHKDYLDNEDKKMNELYVPFENAIFQNIMTFSQQGKTQIIFSFEDSGANAYDVNGNIIGVENIVYLTEYRKLFENDKIRKRLMNKLQDEGLSSTYINRCNKINRHPIDYQNRLSLNVSWNVQEQTSDTHNSHNTHSSSGYSQVDLDNFVNSYVNKYFKNSSSDYSPADLDNLINNCVNKYFKNSSVGDDVTRLLNTMFKN